MRSHAFDDIGYDVRMDLKPKKRFRLHLVLFLLTAGTTYLVGLGNGPVGALWYSGGLMAILICHEAGHYLAARRHGIRASLPYFIPLPLPPFGTMGAVIKMDSRIPHRRALLDVGAAGPFAGLAVILPVIYFGLRMSEIVHLETLDETGIVLGDSLLFRFLSRVTLGPLEKGQDILLHPLAFAGWVGLLITAINLLPVGQLDGGHILYALFHRHGKPVAGIVYGFFIVICLFFYFGWFLMLVLVAIFRKHPPTLADEIPLDPGRKWAGALALSLFVLSLTPVPFGVGEGLVPMILKGVQGTWP
ncbi:MAG TPA: site-2 protease family protein [bacterium]|nr:site-2 protease family protein [bacterium]